MSWVQRGLVAGVVGLGVLIAVNRTGGSAKAGLDPAKGPLRDATYAAAIPVMPGAKLEDEMGGNYSDNLGGPVTFTSHSWFFTLDAPFAAAVDFYTKNLPAGAQRTEAEAGEVAFSWTPPGSVMGEEVTVRLEAGRLQVTEVVKAKS